MHTWMYALSTSCASLRKLGCGWAGGRQSSTPPLVLGLRLEERTCMTRSRCCCCGENAADAVPDDDDEPFRRACVSWSVRSCACTERR